MYDFFCNNCHNFVGNCLNELNYDNRNNYNVIELGWNMFFSKYFVKGFIGKFKTFFGFILILICFIIYLILMKFMLFNK